MESIHVRVGRRVHAERKRLGLTQELLAEKAHLSTAFIGQIERGQNTASLASLEKIARALNLPLAELLRHASPKSPKAPAAYSQKILSLVRERPSQDQQYLFSTLKAIVRRLDGAGRKRPER